jgi:hypothetical protein
VNVCAMSLLAPHLIGGPHAGLTPATPDGRSKWDHWSRNSRGSPPRCPE